MTIETEKSVRRRIDAKLRGIAGAGSSRKPGDSTTRGRISPRIGEESSGSGTLWRRDGSGMTASGYLLLFSSILCAVIGAMSIAIAVRERRRGSAPWAWLLPGVFGVLFAVGCVVRLAVMAS